MALKDLPAKLFDQIPPNVMRVIAGGVALGLALMLFLKVVDEVFDVSVPVLNWIAVGVTILFALLLCSGNKVLYQQCLSFGAGAIVIFAVGLTSNNVIADIRSTFEGASEIASASGGSAEPPPVPPLESIVDNRP